MVIINFASQVRHFGTWGRCPQVRLRMEEGGEREGGRGIPKTTPPQKSSLSYVLPPVGDFRRKRVTWRYDVQGG